jgi:hypothetical protein
LSGASYRTRSDGDITAKFYFVFKQIFHALPIDTYQNKISRFSSSLKAKACPRYLYENRRTPSSGGSTCGNALAVLGAYNKCPFLEARNHRYTLSLRGYV